MLLLGVFLAVVGMLLTRKSEIVTHDPLDGLPGHGKLDDAVSAVREVARRVQEQALEAQARAQQSQGFNTQPGRRQDSKAVILEQIKDLAQRGQAVDAIKLYRMSFRADLKTAKEAVDRLASGG